MSEPWPFVALGDLCEIRSGYAFKSSTWAEEGTPVLQIANIKDGYLDKASLKYVDEDTAATAAKFSTREGDILVAMTGYVGSVARISTLETGFLVNQRVGRIENIDALKVGGTFLYWALRLPTSKSAMVNLSNGSAQANLSAKEFGKIEIPLPPVAVQRRIAGVLGALDDLIDTNKRLTASLLVTVDALYVTRFGDHSLGLTIADVARVVDCLHSKKPEPVSGGARMLQLNNIRDDGTLALDASYGISDADYALWTKNIETSPWDCVITNVGRVGAVARIPEGVKAALGRNMTAVRPLEPEIDGAYLLASLKSPIVREEIRLRTDVGTILDALNVKSIPLLRLPVATRDERAEFQSLAGPMLMMVDELDAEIRQVKATRDELLPLLLSGAVTVSEVAA